MKRSFNLFKKGFSLIEVLVSILIFTIIFLGSFYFVSKFRTNYQEFKDEFDNEIIIDGLYQCFSSNPIGFKDKLVESYDGEWLDNDFIFNNENIVVKYYEDKAIIKVVLYIDDVEGETWIRVKRVLY